MNYCILKNKFYWRFWVRKSTLNYSQLTLSIPKCRILGIHLRHYKELYRLLQISWYCCHHLSDHTVEPVYFKKSFANSVFPFFLSTLQLKVDDNIRNPGCNHIKNITDFTLAGCQSGIPFNSTLFHVNHNFFY